MLPSLFAGRELAIRLAALMLALALSAGSAWSQSAGAIDPAPPGSMSRFAVGAGERRPAVVKTAGGGPGAEPRRRSLTVESVRVRGNAQTPAAKILSIADLEPGQEVDPASIASAARRLESSGLFAEVAVHTRAGARPGELIVVFDVEERRPHVRLGVGYEDLSGWYLIPVQLNLDNVAGLGERFRLNARLGLRLGGLEARYRLPALSDPRRYVELRLWGESQDRLYFARSTEIRHRLRRGGADLEGQIPLSTRLALGLHATAETVEPDSSAEVHRDREALDWEQGDRVGYEELPPEVRRGLGRRAQRRLGLHLTIDTRRGGGLERRGIWGRTGAELVAGDEETFGLWRWDLRAYLPLSPALQAALRTQAGIAATRAPFYERFYLGGLYTVRGYPSQSLSPAGGDTHFAAGSLELRGRWLGPPADPQLTGLIFLDLGLGWSSGAPSPEDGAAGAGAGLRARLPWLGRLGLDAGVPLGPSPVEEAFHVNLSIGWTY
ncbi:MAG: BamA/TamA family outer membrane protein [Candidatus Eisenbacteria bacterium]|nr:BamA/TamA family outer membrane protein [Candidatus Eisenbacteria bacterium]